ncbi:tRNA (adenosine(37)-N6)-threonylcarbamoyltransferase complex transferase subunit TsaD [bacterium]|nr:tRNA (adenosine(37)-N6)-threonylcarbamoyltransferase complex transferase subunit TsaD [bacterium]
MLILGIESSCDDSSAAVVSDGTEILSNVIASQEKYHSRYGGVVPEIAARKHLEHIQSVIHLSLEEANVDIKEIKAIAVTHRPGLIGSLIVGLTAAKSLAYIYQKPLIGIHHIEAHTYSACLSGMRYGTPHIALVASGGHTSLLHMTENNEMLLIGHTVDDAAGEAFDKVAKLLGFGYPGGPIIDRLAKQCNGSTINFPRPMLKRKDLNFSFSGLKTAVMYHHKTVPETPSEETACAFQEAVIDVLVTKTLRAVKLLRLSTISVVGGVAANSGLRKCFQEKCQREKIQVFIPEPRLCTDNAAMVAGLGYQKFVQSDISDLSLGVDSHAGLIPINITL